MKKIFIFSFFCVILTNFVSAVITYEIQETNNNTITDQINDTFIIGGGYTGTTTLTPTMYTPLFGDGTAQATEGNRNGIASVNGTITNLYVYIGTAGSTQVTFTLQINSSDTAATCTTDAVNGATCSIKNISVPFYEGQIISMKANRTGSNAVGNWRWSATAIIAKNITTAPIINNTTDGIWENASTHIRVNNSYPQSVFINQTLALGNTFSTATANITTNTTSLFLKTPDNGVSGQNPRVEYTTSNIFFGFHVPTLVFKGDIIDGWGKLSRTLFIQDINNNFDGFLFVPHKNYPDDSEAFTLTFESNTNKSIITTASTSGLFVDRFTVNTSNVVLADHITTTRIERDNSTLTTAMAQYDFVLSPYCYWQFREDFISADVNNNFQGENNWRVQSLSNVGVNLASAGQITQKGKYGIKTISNSGTSGGSWITLQKMVPTGSFLINGSEIFIFNSNLNQLGDPAGYRATTRWGVSDITTSGSGSLGLYWEYNRNISANYILRSKSVSGETNITTNITVDTDWHNYTIIVSPTASYAEFYRDDTLAGNITSNLPTSSLTVPDSGISLFIQMILVQGSEEDVDPHTFATDWVTAYRDFNRCTT